MGGRKGDPSGSKQGAHSSTQTHNVWRGQRSSEVPNGSSQRNDSSSASRLDSFLSDATPSWIIPEPHVNRMQGYLDNFDATFELDSRGRSITSFTDRPQLRANVGEQFPHEYNVGGGDTRDSTWHHQGGGRLEAGKTKADPPPVKPSKFSQHERGA